MDVYDRAIWNSRSCQGFRPFRELLDVRDQTCIENAFAIVGGIKAAIEVDLGAAEVQTHLFGHVLQRVQSLREQDHVCLIDGSHGDRG